MKYLLPFSLIISLFIGGCSMPTSYYTSPQSAGYNQQKLGGICEHCGKQFNLSGNQLNNVPLIKCPYCGNLSNTKEAAARWVPVKNQINRQVNQQIMLGLMQGVAAGTNSNNTSSNPTTTYQISGCSSDYSCGIGFKCVKEQFTSNGVCMKAVNEYGTQSYSSPNPNSIGVNLDDHQCTSDTDCPIGFRCDSKYKTCIK